MQNVGVRAWSLRFGAQDLGLQGLEVRIGGSGHPKPRGSGLSLGFGVPDLGLEYRVWSPGRVKALGRESLVLRFWGLKDWVLGYRGCLVPSKD